MRRAELAFGSWSLAASHTARRLDEPGDGSGPLGFDPRDRLTQVSLGYSFDNGFGVAIGAKRERVQRADADFIGLLLTYDFAFDAGASR